MITNAQVFQRVLAVAKHIHQAHDLLTLSHQLQCGFYSSPQNGNSAFCWSETDGRIKHHYFKHFDLDHPFKKLNTATSLSLSCLLSHGFGSGMLRSPKTPILWGPVLRCSQNVAANELHVYIYILFCLALILEPFGQF